MKQPKSLIVPVAAVVLAVAAALSYGFMASRRAAAEIARGDLQSCQRDVATIEALRHRPQLASEHERLAAEVTGLIEQAARGAGIGPASLRRITPESPQRLGDTAYKEKGTLLELDDVTLQQIVRLVHGLVSADQGLHPKSIRLTAPRKAAADNVWTAEIVLTYVIYDPIQPREVRKQP